MKIFSQATGLRVMHAISGLLLLYTSYFHFQNYAVMAVYVPLPVGSKYFVLFVATLLGFSGLALVLGKEIRKAYFATAITFTATGLMVLIPTIHFSNDYYLKLIQLPNVYKLVIASVLFILLIAIKPGNKE